MVVADINHTGVPEFKTSTITLYIPVSVTWQYGVKNEVYMIDSIKFSYRKSYTL